MSQRFQPNTVVDVLAVLANGVSSSIAKYAKVLDTLADDAVYPSRERVTNMLVSLVNVERSLNEAGAAMMERVQPDGTIESNPASVTLSIMFPLVHACEGEGDTCD